MSTQNSSSEVKYGLSSPAPNRSSQPNARLKAYGLVPPRVGDALSAFLSSAPTPRRRDDVSVYSVSEPAVPLNSFSRPAPSRMNSFASARPSGPYYQNPFYNYPSYALPFQDNSPFNQLGTRARYDSSNGPNHAPPRRLVSQSPKGYVAHDPFRPSHGKKHDKVPEDLTFDNIPSSEPTPTQQVYPTGYGPGEIINYGAPGSAQYPPQGMGEINYGPQAQPNPGYSSQPPPPPLQTYQPSPFRPRPASYAGDNYAVPTPNNGNPFSQPQTATPPPALPPFRVNRTSANPYEQEAGLPQDTETAPFSYPPTSPPPRPTADDRLSVLAPILEDRESSQNSLGRVDSVPERYEIYDPYDPAQPRPVSPGLVFIPDIGAGFGSIPDLNDDDDPTARKRSWWHKVLSFLLIIAIILCLPVLFPINLIWKWARNEESDYAEVGSVTQVPSRVDQAIAYVSQVPRTVYHHILLRLPSLYFARVARIFEEADLSLNDLKTMALESASKNKPVHYSFETSRNLPPAYESLKLTWEEFISSLLREWKTFNLISVLLLSAILTILQLGGASEDPFTRYFALSSLVCALISLLYGCIYIIRFGTMRKPYKAAEWALEAKKSRQAFYWNVWVLLAMPAVYLAWSLLLFICCIMAFVWRTGGDPNASPPTGSALLHTIMRGIISGILALGCIYGVLIGTTFQRYGQRMDRAWKARISGWIEERAIKAAAACEEYLDTGYGGGDPVGQQPYGPYPPQGPPFMPRQMSPEEAAGKPYIPPLSSQREQTPGFPEGPPRRDEEERDFEEDGDDIQEMTGIFAAAGVARSVRGIQDRGEAPRTTHPSWQGSPDSVGSMYLTGDTGRYAVELTSLAEASSGGPPAPSSTLPDALGSRKRNSQPAITVHQPSEGDDGKRNGQGVSSNQSPPQSYTQASSSSRTRSDSYIEFTEIQPTPRGSLLSSPNPSHSASLPPSPHTAPASPRPLPPPPPAAHTTASSRPQLRTQPSLSASLKSTSSGVRRRSPPIPPPPPRLLTRVPTATSTLPTPFVPPPPPPLLPPRKDKETANSSHSNGGSGGNHPWFMQPSPARSYNSSSSRDGEGSVVASSLGGYESEVPLVTHSRVDTGSSVSGSGGRGSGEDFVLLAGKEGLRVEGSLSSLDGGHRKAPEGPAGGIGFGEGGGGGGGGGGGEVQERGATLTTVPTGYDEGLLLSSEDMTAGHVRRPSDSSEFDFFKRKTQGEQVLDVKEGNLLLSSQGTLAAAAGGDDCESDIIDAQLDAVFARRKGSRADFTCHGMV